MVFTLTFGDCPLAFFDNDTLSIKGILPLLELLFTLILFLCFCGNISLAPNATTTRAMIVTILYRLEGQPAVGGMNPFNDVENGKWFTDAIVWANQKGIVDGYGNRKFGPTDYITREQFAAIMYRYAQFKGYDTSKSADLSAYTDAASVSSWAIAPIKWANAENLITGRSATTLVPKGNATRAEAAAILKRFIENIK